MKPIYYYFEQKEEIVCKEKEIYDTNRHNEQENDLRHSICSFIVKTFLIFV